MENHRTFCCTPSGARLRYLLLRSRVLDFYIPPKSPFGKGGLRQGSSFPRNTKKSEKLSFLASVPPQGLEPWTPTLRVSCSTN